MNPEVPNWAKGVVAKPKIDTSEIGTQVDTQMITWPPTASLSPEDYFRSFFVQGKTAWDRCLS